MKKNRNAFFSESNYQSYTPNMNPYQNNAPIQSGSNYFYQGPLPTNYNINNMENDIENRLSKIERQINRLDYRISKIENLKNISSVDDFDTNNTNMYML